MSHFFHQLLMELRTIFYVLQASKSGGTKRGKTLMDMVEENLRNESPEKKLKVEEEEKDDNANDKEADFEEWKRKILEAAAAAE